MSEQDKPVWFITGCSTGFGRELARAYARSRLPGRRHRAKARRVADLAVGREARALVLQLDVTKPEEIAAAVAAAQAKFGRIDVLVNNAGIGYFGAVEESDDGEVRRMFEINFWGLANMTRAVLPGMRARRSGHIVNISSMGGVRGAPARRLLQRHQIRPRRALRGAGAGNGAARDQGSHRRAERLSHGLGRPVGQRDAASDRRLRFHRGRAAAPDSRPSAASSRAIPARAAAAIVEAVEASDAPLRLMLGKAALAAGRAKIESLKRDFESWAEVSEGADFPVS